MSRLGRFRGLTSFGRSTGTELGLSCLSELDDVAVEAVWKEDSFVGSVGDAGDHLQDLSGRAAEGERGCGTGIDDCLCGVGCGRSLQSHVGWSCGLADTVVVNRGDAVELVAEGGDLAGDAVECIGAAASC